MIFLKWKVAISLDFPTLSVTSFLFRHVYHFASMLLSCAFRSILRLREEMGFSLVVPHGNYHSARHYVSHRTIPSKNLVNSMRL